MICCFYFSPVQNKLGLIGNPDNVVLHGMGEKAALKKVFLTKSNFKRCCRLGDNGLD